LLPVLAAWLRDDAGSKDALRLPLSFPVEQLDGKLPPPRPFLGGGDEASMGVSGLGWHALNVTAVGYISTPGTPRASCAGSSSSTPAGTGSTSPHGVPRMQMLNVSLVSSTSANIRPTSRRLSSRPKRRQRRMRRPPQPPLLPQPQQPNHRRRIYELPATRLPAPWPDLIVLSSPTARSSRGWTTSWRRSGHSKPKSRRPWRQRTKLRRSSQRRIRSRRRSRPSFQPRSPQRMPRWRQRRARWGWRRWPSARWSSASGWRRFGRIAQCFSRSGRGASDGECA